MARARSHGAAAAAHTRTSPSPGRNGGANNNREEGVGLLAAGPDPEEDDDDAAIIVHPDDASPDAADHQQRLHPSRTPRTPRTPNRVRFDLRPTFVNGNDDHPHPPPRESFHLDDEDPLTHDGEHRQHPHRVPLLTDIEAPSVTLSTSALLFSTHEEAESWAAAERARPKSTLRAAFVNMANSIIGAGIIGQAYALRQAGLLAGVALLVGLTAVVDWTICLIVVNSKLSGASSFQGTVERCFGRPGLVAVSVAQWAFAFGGMVAFGVIVGDSIPSVLRAVWPGLSEMPVLGLLADRRAVIVVFTLGVSYPLTLYRDIAKVSTTPG